MNRPLSFAFRSSLVTGLLVTGALAQDPGDSGPPAGPAPATVRSGLEQHVSLDWGVRPKSVEPGKGGDIVLILSPMGESILTPDQRLDLEYPRRQGELTLGDWEIVTAPTERGRGALAGRQRYADNVTIRIPFTADDPVHYPKLQTIVTVTMGVLTGADWRPLGVFLGDVRPVVEITDHTPFAAPPTDDAGADGGTAPGSGAGAGDGAVMGITSNPVSASAGVATTPEAPIRSGDEPGTEAAAAAADGPDPTAPPTREAEDDQTFLFAGIAAAVVFAAVVLLRLRGRS